MSIEKLPLSTFISGEALKSFERTAHCQCDHYLRGLRRGSDRSRGGLGSSVAATVLPGSGSVAVWCVLPGRDEDEAVQADEGSRERRSGLLYAAIDSPLQCGPGLVERDE